MTLPRHVFEEKLQVVLIDGINIPSIKSMFEIVKAGDVFELVELVEHTAFLRRTEAPLSDPLSDSWWLQGVNRPHYEHIWHSLRTPFFQAPPRHSPDPASVEKACPSEREKGPLER